MAEQETPKYKLQLSGYLKGHNGWVTCMKVGEEEVSKDNYKEFLITGSRDKSLIIWDIAPSADTDEDKAWGQPRKVMKGHSHFISDLDLSQDSRFALSSSWDGTIRLWNLKSATTRTTLIGHTKDVLSVAFSPDNRQIASGAMDKQVKIWNIHGECKFTVDTNQHTDWVSCVRYFQDLKTPIVVSASWDKTVKVWDNSVMGLMHTFVGHQAQINTLDLAPNTNLIASGGRDGKVNIWNLVEGRHLDEVDAESPVNVVLFASKLYWLVIGTEKGIQVYDLPGRKFIDKYEVEKEIAAPVEEKKRSRKAPKLPAAVGCTSLVWSKNQQHLYAGFTDGTIRVLAIVDSDK
jgi:guanine nucleotide-binding protein subunit beta-2-like 1 protein